MLMLLANAPANLAANLPANAPGDSGSSLELYFGFMAAGAVVVMLLWLYFRTQQPLPQTPAQEPPGNPPSA